MNSWIRLLLFLCLCIPIRLLLAYIPQVLPKCYLLYLGFIVGLMGIGTLYLAFTNSRLHSIESGGLTWWAPYRFIHGMLLLTACIYLSKKDRLASIPLLLDAILGIFLFFIIRLGIFDRIINKTP